ncbi:MAG: methionyl-tRNA formyltransferase [bacterium]|nr:methionyl-tRNA formyltransferase [bacterium]
MQLKIIFMGTPEFGAIILEELIKGGYPPVLVITAPDKPVGRKQIITPPPVKISAQKYNIPILQPEKILNLKSEILNLKPDLIIVAAYGQILPKEILEIPKYGCLNIHPSLLPKYRGSSPIQYTILNGDKETGLTIILMTEKVDEGDVIAISKFQIANSKITYPELLMGLAHKGTKLLCETIPEWVNNEIKPKPQNGLRATYTKILKKEDGKIDWKKPAKYIERQIRAFHPWPGSFSEFQISNQKSRKLKLLKADVLVQTKNGPFGVPGKTFLATNDKIAVQTGKDFLVIEKLQFEGKKPMSSEEFLKGNLKFIGEILK